MGKQSLPSASLSIWRFSGRNKVGGLPTYGMHEFVFPCFVKHGSGRCECMRSFVAPF